MLYKKSILRYPRSDGTLGWYKKCLVVQKTVDSVVNIDNFLAKLIVTRFVCEMEIFTNKLLPSSINPFLFQSRLGINTMMVSQVLNGIIQTVFLVFNSLKAQQ